MISLDLMKSSEVRIAGDQPNSRGSGSMVGKSGTMVGKSQMMVGKSWASIGLGKLGWVRFY